MNNAKTDTSSRSAVVGKVEVRKSALIPETAISGALPHLRGKKVDETKVLVLFFMMITKMIS